MESFRLYRPKPDPVPSQFVKEYKPHELDQFREAFRPQAVRYRWHLRLAILGVLGGLATILFTVLLQVPQIAFLFPVLWLIGFASIGSIPLLECPACRGAIRRLTTYCPACGSSKFQGRDSWQPAHCESCDKDLHCGKHRNFKIRYCTHCGIPLDERGI
jgi:hypothetical protein